MHSISVVFGVAQAIQDDNNPVFDEKFELPVLTPSSAKLRVQLYDQDDMGHDDTLGEAILSLHELVPFIGRDRPFTVSLDTQGSVTFDLHLVAPKSSAQPAVPSAMQYKLRIHLQSASNLINADTFSASDPYVRFSIDGDNGNSSIARSKIIQDNNSPIFNEHVELPVSTPATARLRVQLYDEDVGGKDDSLGEATVPLQELASATGRDRPFTVTLNTQGSVSFVLHLVAPPKTVPPRLTIPSTPTDPHGAVGTSSSSSTATATAAATASASSTTSFFASAAEFLQGKNTAAPDLPDDRAENTEAIPCPHKCGQVIPPFSSDVHFAKCPRMPIACEYGCESRVPRSDKAKHDAANMLQHLQFMRQAHERMLQHTSKLEQEKQLLAQRLERERQEQEKAQETNIKLQKEIKRLARPERQREEDEICALVQHSQFKPECFPTVRSKSRLSCHASVGDCTFV